MPRILLTDDSMTIRKMLRASLRAIEGVEFFEAATGLEAIEQLAVTPVDLMLLDLNMPDMHGIDVLRFVRRQDQHRNLPIIVLTTRDDDSSRGAAIEAGATTYMTKPFTPQSLVATVQTLLAGAGANSAARV